MGAEQKRNWNVLIAEVEEYVWGQQYILIDKRARMIQDISPVAETVEDVIKKLFFTKATEICPNQQTGKPDLMTELK